MGLLQVDSELGGAVARVALAGELDLSSASALKDPVRRLIERHPPSHLLLDLRRLTFVDSTGLHLLHRLAVDARTARWRLTVVRGPAQIQRTMALVGLSEGLD